MFAPIQVRISLCAALLATSLIAGAQKFQEPTHEELQMTADAKAPGAPAVYLNLENTTDNRNHYVSRYARIKVLTELGKEWATVEVPYVPGYSAVPIITGRTIHADGTVVPLTGKAEDLLVFKTTRNNVKASVFNLPSVEVGSILEYKWTISLLGGDSTSTDTDEALYGSLMASSIPEWEVQEPIFVHKEHFYFNPFTSLETNVGGNQEFIHYADGEIASYLLYTQRLPAGSNVTKSPRGDYTLDIQDVPALRKHADSPPQGSFAYRVRFYYTPYISSETYWDSELKRWSKELDGFASPGGGVKSAADEFVAGLATPEAKARKLYEMVQKFENTDFTRVKSEAERTNLHLRKELKNAADVLREERGSGNDLAALYLALARAEGLEAYGMKVADRRRRIFDTNYLSLEQLDALLVVVRIDGKDIYTDPGQKLCPFGQLVWYHILAGGLEEGAKAPAYTPQNLTKDAVTAHTAELTVDAHGGVTGTAKILMNGPAALEWRQLNLTADGDEVNKRFTERLHGFLPDGIEGEVAGIQGLDNPNGFLTVSVKVQGQLGNATGKRLLLPAFFFSTTRPQFVSEETRDVAIDLHFAEQAIDDVIYHLPAGYSVESAPAAVQLPWPDHAALVVKTQPGNGTLEIKHIFARAFVLLDAKEYPALRDYYQKVATNDAQQVVLALGSAAPGN